MPSQCSSRNKSGQPCSAQAWKDSLCRWHHPELEAQRAEERRRGGHARSNASRARKRLTSDLRDMADVRIRMMSALEKVERGELEPNVGTAMATITRAIAAISGVADFELQLAELRREVAELAERRGA